MAGNKVFHQEKSFDLKVFAAQTRMKSQKFCSFLFELIHRQSCCVNSGKDELVNATHQYKECLFWVS